MEPRILGDHDELSLSISTLFRHHPTSDSFFVLVVFLRQDWRHSAMKHPKLIVDGRDALGCRRRREELKTLHNGEGTCLLELENSRASIGFINFINFTSHTPPSASRHRLSACFRVSLCHRLTLKRIAWDGELRSHAPRCEHPAHSRPLRPCLSLARTALAFSSRAYRVAGQSTIITGKYIYIPITFSRMMSSSQPFWRLVHLPEPHDLRTNMHHHLTSRACLFLSHSLHFFDAFGLTSIAQISSLP